MLGNDLIGEEVEILVALLGFEDSVFFMLEAFDVELGVSEVFGRILFAKLLDMRLFIVAADNRVF